MKRSRLTWSVLLLVAACAVRVLWLGSIPGGINHDEAAVGYQTWALLNSGMDQHGLGWLHRLVDWGTPESPLYTCLSMPFIALGGLTVSATRLPAAIAGVLSLVMFWKLGKRTESGMAEWSLLLIATSPWHIMASRWGQGAHVAPAIVLFAVMLMERAEARSAHVPLAALLLTTSVYAQGTAALFAVAFFVWAFILVHRASPISRRALARAFLASPVVLLPLAALVERGFGDVPRPTHGPRYGAMFLPFVTGGIERVPDNAAKLVTLLVGATKDGSPFEAAGFNPEYVILVPFLILGILYASSRESLVDRLMLAWFVCAMGAAACFDATIESMSLIWLPSLWLSARGLWVLREVRLVSLAVRWLVLAAGVGFVVSYFAVSGSASYEGPWVGFGEAIVRAAGKAPPDATVFVTGHTPRAHVPTLFFTRTPPSRFLSTAVMPGAPGAAVDALGFDRFRFGVTLEQLARRTEPSFWVVHRSELGLFDNEVFVAETFGQHTVVNTRSAADMWCLSRVDPLSLKGFQDLGALGVDGSVNSSGAGFTISGQHFGRGFGVHGNSVYEWHLNTGARELSFGIAMSDTAVCSDGVTFTVFADGKNVFSSKPLRVGEIEYHVVPLDGAKVLKFVTHAGLTNMCDHANWLRPAVLTCRLDATLGRH